MKKHRKSTKPVSRWPKRFSFFFLFFFFFRQATSNFKIVTLSQWFIHKTAAFYAEQCTSPSLFHNFEVSQGSLNRSLNNYGFISDAILKICIHVHKSLSNETIIIQDCWIRNTVVCTKTGRVFGMHCWLSVVTEPGQWFFSQYCIHLWGSLWGQACCSVMVNLAQACTCC